MILKLDNFYIIRGKVVMGKKCFINCSIKAILAFLFLTDLKNFSILPKDNTGYYE